MDRLFGDLVSGVRMLVRYPTLSLVAIVTLGLGIGLSTTVFCVVNGGLFKGLPFPNADRIVAVVRDEPVAEPAAPADQRPRPRGAAGAADVVRGARRVRRPRR